MFHVGQKVVCITDMSWCIHNPNYRGETIPVKDGVYTVRSFATDVFGRDCMLLHEIINEHRCYIEGVLECAFDVNHFRPIIERKNESGMSILTDILVKTKVKEPA